MKKYIGFLLLFVALSVSATPPTSEIIEGTTVSETQYPYVARLTVDGDLLCSGTLIAPRYILTAAHCFFDDRNRRGVGDTDVVARLNGQEYSSVAVTIHPSYRSRSSACVEGETDAAVIQLASDVNGITPAPIVDSALATGTQLVLVGYGEQGDGPGGQNGTIPAVGFVNVGPTVLEGYGDTPPELDVNSSYIYWGFDQGESNTASGDSGGPAFFNNGSQNILVALTCGGDGNAEFGTLSFDTRADIIKSWVQSITGQTGAGIAPSFPVLRNIPARVGEFFSYRVGANGSAPIVIDVVGLPDGLSYDGLTITGIPTTPGTFSLQFNASNSTGNASTTVSLVITGYAPSVSMSRVLLQFDYEEGANDFLDIDGKIYVGPRFKPANKTVVVQIGRFSQTFTLRGNGQSREPGRTFFDLSGEFNGRAFRRKRVDFFLTFEQVAIFDELSTLGFPSSANASEGQEVALPLSVTIDGVEYSTTAILTFKSRDARWRIKR